MSAFVVQDKTINRILYWLRSTTYGRHENTWFCETVACAAGLENVEATSVDFLQRMGASMAMLNTDAVNQRYSESSDAAFEYRVEPCNDHQALKSLRCWLYQCSEGNVPERELYKAWELVSYRLALAIVDRSDAYAKCDWA